MTISSKDSKTPAVNFVEIPRCPTGLNPRLDLQPNGKLHDEAEIARIKAAADKLGVGKHKKGIAIANTKFSLVVVQDPKTKKNKYYEAYGKKLKADGGEGHVRRAVDLETGKPYMLKIQPKKFKYNKSSGIHLAKEEHDRLVDAGQGHGHLTRAPHMHKNKMKPEQDIMVMELAWGQDTFYCSDDEKIQLGERLDIIIGMIASIVDLHQKGLLHCDIKLENFIYDELYKVVKAIDFGFALKGKIQNDILTGTAAGFAGTPHYVAPELLNKTVHVYDEKTESFALSVAIARFLFMYSEFKSPDAKHVYENRRLLTEKEIAAYNKLPIPETDRKEVREKLKEMRNPDPLKRITPLQALQYFKDLKIKLVGPDKPKRVAVIDISEYLKSSNDQQNDIRHKIKEFDEVTLIGAAAFTPKDLIILRNDLENTRIRVNDKGYLALSDFMNDTKADFSLFTASNQNPPHLKIVTIEEPLLQKTFKEIDQKILDLKQEHKSSKETKLIKEKILNAAKNYLQEKQNNNHLTKLGAQSILQDLNHRLPHIQKTHDDIQFLIQSFDKMMTVYNTKHKAALKPENATSFNPITRKKYKNKKKRLDELEAFKTAAENVNNNITYDYSFPEHIVIDVSKKFQHWINDHSNFIKDLKDLSDHQQARCYAIFLLECVDRKLLESNFLLSEIFYKCNTSQWQKNPLYQPLYQPITPIEKMSTSITAQSLSTSPATFKTNEAQVMVNNEKSTPPLQNPSSKRPAGGAGPAGIISKK